MRIKPKFKYHTLLLALSVFFFSNADLLCQDPVTDEKTYESRYARNIKKSRINGVYIPSNIEDAMTELEALSSKEALAKFRSGDEAMVAKKLHFGIGRWMIYNWNFYEGSRFSHYLKEMGINHPDDQAKFVIVVLHRKLNEKDLDMDNLILQLQEERRILFEKTNKPVVIKEEKKIKQKN